MKLDVLKEYYFFELNRKQQLESSLTLPVAILTALGGVTVSIAKSFTYRDNVKTYIFVVTLIGLTASLVLVFYYLIRATHRFTYIIIPSSQDLLSFYEQSTDYYQGLGTPYKADKDFELEMKQAYAKASSVNRQNNISKAGFLYRANMSLVLAAAFLAICAVPYFIDEVTRPPAIQKIEVVNLQALTKLRGGDMSDNQNKPSEPSNQNNPPSRPTFPPSTGTREGDQPRKPSFPASDSTKKVPDGWDWTKR